MKKEIPVWAREIVQFVALFLVRKQIAVTDGSVFRQKCGQIVNEK